MSLLSRILNRPAASPPPSRVTESQNQRMLRARFDTQFTTDENRRHWGLADAMSIDASASWMVRRTLRMRSRYEYHNNSYFMGMVDTVANYVIGTGPRLQMLLPDRKLNAAIEKAFSSWSAEVKLAATLRSMRAARIYNGESFALLRTNPNLRNPVKLDVFEVEADQVSSPLFGMYPSQYPDQFFDGVVLDPWGRPETYHVLRQHPGAFGAFVILGYEFDPWPARYVLHDFKSIRPAQQRGIPEALPALPLYAQLRRYNLAVLGAAETAADYAAVIQSDGAADQSPDVEPMDTFELRARMATVLPGGYKISQVHAEQPTTTHDAYTTTILREIARCLNIPLFFVTMDARMANMSSAYVATQPFARSVQVDRSGYDLKLDHILDEFLSEATRIDGLLPRDIPDDLPHTWRWPRIGQHADPAKVASAQETQLACGTSSIPLLCAEDGHDWEEVQESAAKSLGMSVDEYRAALRQKTFAVRGQPAPAAIDPEPDPVPATPESSPEEGDDPESGDDDE